MEVIHTILGSIIGIAIGLIMITFADKIADIIGSHVGTSIVRDTNNPWTYKILGSLLVVASFIGFFI